MVPSGRSPLPCLLTEAGHLLVSVAGATLRTTVPILSPLPHMRTWPTPMVANTGWPPHPRGPTGSASSSCLCFTLVFLYDPMKPSAEPSGGHPAIILGFAGYPSF